MLPFILRFKKRKPVKNSFYWNRYCVSSFVMNIFLTYALIKGGLNPFVGIFLALIAQLIAALYPLLGCLSRVLFVGFSSFLVFIAICYPKESLGAIVYSILAFIVLGICNCFDVSVPVTVVNNPPNNQANNQSSPNNNQSANQANNQGNNPTNTPTP